MRITAEALAPWLPEEKEGAAATTSGETLEFDLLRLRAEWKNDRQALFACQKQGFAMQDIMVARGVASEAEITRRLTPRCEAAPLDRNHAEG